jgi:magnesium transporter
MLTSADLVLAHTASSALSSFPYHSGHSSTPSLLRCILFDKDGRYRIMSTDVQKTQLLLKHDLLPRDLRKIDKGYDDIVPLIVIREKSILLSILHIKALIKSDSVVLFNYDGTYSDNKLISNMTEKLKNIQGDKLDYEIRALETIFADVIDNLMIEMQIHVTVVNGILKELENDLDLAKLKYLLIVSKKLGQFLQKATLIRDLIDEMLDHDDELSELYLTEKKHGTQRSKDNHQEVELILESYSLHCDAIVQTIESRVNDVRTTEEIINIILDSNRNDLMLLNLNLSITLMCLAGLLFVAASYGMNLENFIEEKNLWFWIVSGGSTFFSIVLFRLANKRLTKLQKIQLSNR